MRVGTLVRARFRHDGSQQWFNGEIIGSAMGGWKVRFEDGDEPIMPEHSLRLRGQEHERQPAPLKLEESPPPMPEGAVVKEEEEEPTAEEQPRPSPESGAELKDEFKIKEEQFEAARKGKSREHTAREKLREKHLVEADGVTPTKLFRRMKTGGAKGGSIGCMLGGQAMHPCPVNNSEDKYIPKGHIFVAGNNGFNPYLPWFAGDDGFVEEEFVADRPNEQQTVPFFRECTSRDMFPLGAYHGKSAVGGRLYVGQYSVSDLSFDMAFNEYHWYTQEYRTEWEVRARRAACGCPPKTRSPCFVCVGRCAWLSGMPRTSTTATR